MLSLSKMSEQISENQSNIPYFWEKDRLNSFTKWPFDESKACNKAKMAEAGFYFNGNDNEPDIATCFACSKTLDGWEPQDNPWNEHIKHAPQCIFVKFGKPEDKFTVSKKLRVIFDILVNFCNM